MGDTASLRVKATADTQDLERKMRRGKIAIAALAASAGVGLLALRKMAQVMGKAMTAAGVQEQAVVNLSAALRRAGVDDVPKATAEFSKFASEMQAVTRFGDEATIQAASLGASFGITGKQLQQTTMAAADMASVTGQSLTSAMLLLGKAAKGETGTLSRYGIIIDKNVPKSKKFEAALAAIQQQFGGDAAATAKTYQGRLEQIGNAYGDMFESLGFIVTRNQAVKTIMNEVTQAISILSGFIDDNRDAMSKLVTGGIVFAATGFLELKRTVLLTVAVFKSFPNILSSVTGVMGTIARAMVDAMIAPLEAIGMVIGKFGELIGIGEEVARVNAEIDAEMATLLSKLTAIGEAGPRAFAGIDRSAIVATGSVGNLTKALDLTLMMAERVGDALGASMAALITGAKTAEEAVLDMVQVALGAVLDFVIQSIKANAANAAAGAASSQAAIPVVGPALAVAAATSIFAFVSGMLTKFHSGGQVSSSDLVRMPGMASDEGIAVLRAGEEVITEGQGAGSRGVNITVNELAPTSRANIRRKLRDIWIPELQAMGVV